MNESTIIAIIILAAVVAVGILLKQHTKKKLKDIDGLGSVTKKSESNIIGRF